MRWSRSFSSMYTCCCSHFNALEILFSVFMVGSLRSMSDPNNGIVVHVAKSQHRIDWTGAKVVRSVQGYWERRTMEAIEIKRSKCSMTVEPSIRSNLVPPPHL